MYPHLFALMICYTALTCVAEQIALAIPPKYFILSKYGLKHIICQPLKLVRPSVLNLGMSAN